MVRYVLDSTVDERDTPRVVSPRLSKTRYLSGCQCHLKLWYDCYERELETEVDVMVDGEVLRCRPTRLDVLPSAIEVMA